VNKKQRPKILTDACDLETEIGHIAVNAEIKGDIAEWLTSCDENIEKFLVIWVQRDTGNLKLFGTNMKCVEAIGYLEVAKGDLLEYMYNDEDEQDD